jgi:hypothetical protein
LLRIDGILSILPQFQYRIAAESKSILSKKLSYLDKEHTGDITGTE